MPVTGYSATERDAELRGLVELGASCRARAEFRALAVDRLARRVGFDVAFAGVLDGSTDEPPHLRNVLPVCWDAFDRHAPRFLRELDPLIRAARSSGGVAADTQVYDARTRRRLAFYAHCVRPNHSRFFMAVHLSLRGRETTVLHLGRAGQYDRPFGDAELALVRHVVPALALGDGLHECPPRAGNPSRFRLTPRERDVLGYAAIGLRNREIALACGTSINTVRNQLAALFLKLGVTTRTELAHVARVEGLLRSTD